jgi:translation elongation factor EF-Ts
MALKNKVEALQKLLEIITQHGEIEAAKTANRLAELGNIQEDNDDKEKLDAKIETHSTDFLLENMQNNSQQQNGNAQPNSGNAQPNQQTMEGLL